MQLSILKTAPELKKRINTVCSQGARIVLVPTMGALHAGHLSLIEQAKQQKNAHVVASIFVNPTQFAEGEDLDCYPRTLDEDIAKLEKAYVRTLFLPDIATVYPDGPKATIDPGPIAKRWEGEFRPHMFGGVCTVVKRLFDLVKPDVTIFGEKDFQQLAVIRHMIEEYELDIELLGGATMREADGLAMSSRNAYLSKEERKIAPKLFEVLSQIADEASSLRKQGSSDDYNSTKQDPSVRWDDDILVKAKQQLLKHHFKKVDYLAIVDEKTLEPAELGPNTRVLAAAWLGDTRLIDNVKVEHTSSP